MSSKILFKSEDFRVETENLPKKDIKQLKTRDFGSLLNYMNSELKRVDYETTEEYCEHFLKTFNKKWFGKKIGDFVIGNIFLNAMNHHYFLLDDGKVCHNIDEFDISQDFTECEKWECEACLILIKNDEIYLMKVDHRNEYQGVFYVFNHRLYKIKKTNLTQNTIKKDFPNSYNISDYIDVESTILNSLRGIETT
jgi:hypothetical protein